jgi:hypothetical protein
VPSRFVSSLLPLANSVSYREIIHFAYMFLTTCRQSLPVRHCHHLIQSHATKSFTLPACFRCVFAILFDSAAPCMYEYVTIFLSSSSPPSNSVPCHGIAHSARMFFDVFLRHFSTAQLLACVDMWPSSSVHHYHHLIRSHAMELPTLPACFLMFFCNTFRQLSSLHVSTCGHLRQFINPTI